jgi:hypothetical protein
MKLLKFFQGEFIPPEPGIVNISFLDQIGFNDILGISTSIDLSFMEAVAFHDLFQITEELEFTDDIAFNDLFQIAHELEFSDQFGIDDYFYFPDLLDLIDSIGFNDSFGNPNIDRLLEFTETVGFDDSNSNLYKASNILVTWRCRTRTPRWGYGGMPYGDLVSYGDGSTEDIVSFVIDVGYMDISNIFHSSIGTPVEITINDSSDPDADAYYLYNIHSGFKFTNNNVTFKVWQKDVNGVLSPCRQVQVIPMFFE